MWFTMEGLTAAYLQFGDYCRAYQTARIRYQKVGTSLDGGKAHVV